MKRSIFAVSFLAVLCVAAAHFFPTAQQAQSAEVSHRDAQFDTLISRAASSGPLRIIVGLRTEFVPVGALRSEDAAKQGNRIKTAQNAFLSRHYPQRGDASAILFDTIPFAAVQADAELLSQMAADGEITSIEEDVADAPHLAESTQIVNAPAVWSNGFTGSDWAVAVLDTGVMKTHSFLAGKVVAEGCYSQSIGNSTTVCPGGVSQSTAVGSGVNCDPAINGCAHGTHVAGIVAGSSPSASGVAKGANIIAIQVFSSFNSADNCGTTPAPCALSYVSDQIRGLERVLALSSTMNIASINMSLGGGENTSYCDASQASRKAVIDNLRSVNIATIASSGNNGYSTAMGSPACISSAFSVGSTGDGSSGATVDQVVSSSNSATFLNFLAPGRWISSSVPVVGGSTTSFSNYSGTSMAAPHVAGAWAVLRQKKPSATIGEIANALSSTGQMVTDSRNGVIKPRINVGNAITSLGCAMPLTVNQTVQGTLSANDCFVQPDASRYADNYVFEGVAGQQVRIRMSSAAFNSYLYLVDANNQIIAQDNDGGGGTSAQVPASGYFSLPTNGSYSIIATSHPTAGLGNYTLTLEGNCGFALSAPGANTAIGGGPGTFQLSGNSNAGCQFTAVSNVGWITVTGGGTGNGSGTINYTVAANSGAARSGTITAGLLTYTIQQAGSAPESAAMFDFDGDGRSDLSVRRPSDNVWYLQRGTAGYTAMQFGEVGDRMAPADYDGDGKTDVAVFRPSNGTWYIYMSQSQTFQTFGWGQDGDLPVPTDRDADGKTDLVIFRPSNNTWYTRFANGTFNTFEFGVAGDKPVVGDFDGDGKGDIALYRPSNNNWYLLKSNLGFFVQTWGEAGDQPITGDFDGDGATDQAVFRPSTGTWYLSRTTAGFTSQSWGQAGDIPVAADYDGDGKTDVAVFRPSNGQWYIVQSGSGILVLPFGQDGDVPTQSAFNY